MRFTRTITVLVAALTAALLGLTLAPTSAQAADSIQVQPAKAVVAAKGVTPRTVGIADCGPHPAAGCYGKRLWAKFATNPLAPGVKISLYVKRNGHWVRIAKVKTKADGLTKKIYVRAERRKTTRYKVVAKGDAVYAKAVDKFKVTPRY
ncbi:hypothetical protein ACFFOS_07895 [Nocardioides kongjuensis]|uniref:Uncharacterized protein n=1 Tax=Nocardioides kongjuensis TaxID=349522 RepID=A0A852RDH1_9ACTN|nr:hypothetical protein [Nocardioides kongjuensis]NYD33063.1 hypothetical protein [Nocardioides kongjuensis]